MVENILRVGTETEEDARYDYLSVAIRGAEQYLLRLREERGRLEDLWRARDEAALSTERVSPYLRHVLANPAKRGEVA